MRIRGDVQHREVALHEGPGKRTESERDEHELSDDGRTAGRHPGRVSTRCAAEAEYRLRDRQQQREDQREMAKFRNHSDTLAGVGVCRDSATSGGM